MGTRTTADAVVDSATKIATKIASAANTDYLGYFAWYEVDSGLGIGNDDLKALFATHGLDDKYLPTLPSNRLVFSRLIGKVTKGLADTIVAPIQKGGLNKAEVHGLYPVETTDDAKVLDKDAKLGDPLTKIGFIPGDLRADGNDTVLFKPAHPAAGALKANWLTQCGQFASPDVSSFVRDLFRQMARVRLKRFGHIYFVPGQYGDLLAKLSAVVNALPGETALRTIPVPNVPESVIAIQSEARKGLEGDVKALTERIEAFGDKTRETTLDAAIEEARALKEMGALYKAVAQTRVDDLQASLCKLANETRKKLGMPPLYDGKGNEIEYDDDGNPAVDAD